MRLPLTAELTTAGDGANVTRDFTGFGPISLDGQAIRLYLTVDQPTRLGQLSLFVATSSSLAHNIRWRFNAFTTSSELAKPGELTVVNLQLAEINTTAGDITLTPEGRPSVLDGFTAARFQVADDTTAPVTVRLLGAEVVPVSPQAFVTIWFDDGHMSVMNRAYPAMAERGLVGTHATIVGRIGESDRVTLDGLHTLADAGWEIAGHSYASEVHENRYTGVTADVAVADMVDLRDWLAANFPDVDDVYTLAYPGGAYESTTDGVAVEDIAAYAGFTAARTILAEVGVSTHCQIDSLPVPAMPMRLRGLTGISSLMPSGPAVPSRLIGPGGMLDRIKANGGWLNLVFHRVVADAPTQTTEISQSDFDAILDAILARGLTVATARDVLRPAVYLLDNYGRRTRARTHRR